MRLQEREWRDKKNREIECIRGGDAIGSDWMRKRETDISERTEEIGRSREMEGERFVELEWET